VTAPELWGGHECTVNRVGDVWFDQTRMSGHQDRLEDLDLFADLGLKALRYPLLWERTETSPGVHDWTWADARLNRLRDLGVRPIVGLVHHGSGPAWTHLLDEGFADGLARFASAAARRYPWVEDWTPVNEPLTTARFSALYGHWHPHLRDDRAFHLALLNQVTAVRDAMEAIRAVIPHARLIQTEDLGRTWARGAARPQAAFENARRFLTWDLLTGRVFGDHPFHRRMAAQGLGDRLADLSGRPCPPDVVGINHYVTSDRFLDPELGAYPPSTWGGNGKVAYADVEAVRVLDERGCGWGWSLDAAWRRYGLPVAVTECHLGCDVQEQRRWLAQCWGAAVRARASGIDVRAVTVWALLGSHDWASLATRRDGQYEPGVFDLSSGTPRRTGLAELVERLADDGDWTAEGPGWWERQERLIYPVIPTPTMSEGRL